MFKWSRRHKGNKFEYMLVFDNTGDNRPKKIKGVDENGT